MKTLKPKNEVKKTNNPPKLGWMTIEAAMGELNMSRRKLRTLLDYNFQLGKDYQIYFGRTGKRITHILIRQDILDQIRG